MPTESWVVLDHGRPTNPRITGRRWLLFLIGYFVLWGILAGLGERSATGRWGLAILAAVAVAAVAVELVVFRTPARTALRFLGLGRPTGSSLAVAAVVSGLVLLVFPLAAAVTGERFTLVPQAPWMLVGLIAFNGLAEEVVWRGFVFRRLSQDRRFRTAVWWTMPFIAVSHIPILINNGAVVGIGAMAVAAVTSIPFSRLYVNGRGTIWAAAMVHTAIDSFKLVVIPTAASTTFSLLLIAVSLLVPLLALPLLAAYERRMPRSAAAPLKEGASR